MKKYLTYKNDRTRIEEVDVVRETDESVWIEYGKTEYRESKVTGGHIYHDSWESAHNYLVACNRADINRYQAMLDNALLEQAKVQAMTGPK